MNRFCSGQLILATRPDCSWNSCSDAFGVKPPLDQWWSDGIVLARDVADYRALSLVEAVIALPWHSFGLQAPEEPFHRGIIPAFTASTHTLLYSIAPQSLPVLTSGIVTALVTVEHHACWLTSKLLGYLQ